MKSMLLAVFGHYDSRGGTTGIPLEGNGSGEYKVVEAFKKYNNMFGFNEEVEQYKKDPSKWNWDPTEPGSSPAEQDFLFVAELWHEDDADIAGDLEERGAVLINEGTEPKFDGNDRGEFCGEQLNLLIKLTLRRPVQLEFVPMEGGKYTEQQRVEPPNDGNISHADQQEREDRAWQKHVQGLAKKIITGPHMSYSVKDRDWNDDAFGFMIGTGE